MIELVDLHLGPIQGLNLTLAEGKIYALLGPTGSGKTSLMRCMAGIEVPLKGFVAIHGRQLYTDPDLDAAHRAVVGVVFDTHASLPDQTVLENVRLPLDLRGVPVETGDEKAQRLLDELGIGEASQKLPGELSGGMLTRLQLARALIHDPHFLVMDGPTAGLDPVTASRSMRMIARLVRPRGATAVISTQDIRSALPHVDGIVLMSSGLARGPLPPVLAGDVLDFSEGHRPW